MHRRLCAAAALALALPVTLAGCSSSAGAGGACSYDTTFADVAVSGTAGEDPQIEVLPGSQPATELGVQDLCPGDGDAVTQSSVLTVHYEGVAESTGETFDSSHARGAPATFPLGRVIEGWQQGLLGMQEGGTRLLVIPGDLAYGETPPGPGIGPNETLIFVVDLISLD